MLAGRPSGDVVHATGRQALADETLVAGFVVLGRTGLDLGQRRRRHTADDRMMHDTRSVGFEAHTGDPGAIAFGVGDLVDLAAVVVLLLERTDVGLGRARHNVTSDRIEERGGRDKRSVGGDIETTTVDRPLGEDRKFVIGERPVIEKVGALVRGQPRRHVADAGDKRNVIGDRCGITSGVEGQRAPAGTTAAVTAHTVGLEHRHDVLSERPASDLVGGNVALQRPGIVCIEVDAVGDQIEFERDLVVGVSEASDVDRADVERRAENRRGDRRQDPAVGDRGLTDEHDLVGRLLHGEVAGERQRRRIAIDERGGQTFDRRRLETGEGEVGRGEEVMPETLVAQVRVGGEHLDVDDNFTDH